jgi:hypothetical protein
MLSISGRESGIENRGVVETARAGQPVQTGCWPDLLCCGLDQSLQQVLTRVIRYAGRCVAGDPRMTGRAAKGAENGAVMCFEV